MVVNIRYLGQNLAVFDLVVDGNPTEVWVEKC